MARADAQDGDRAVSSSGRRRRRGSANADDPGHREALAASGLTALVTGTRSRAFDDTTLQLVAAG